MKNNISLNGSWGLIYADHGVLLKDGFCDNNDAEVSSPELCDIASLKNTGYSEIPAKVPGCYELDFFAAGIESEPFYGLNPLDYQKYEPYHFFYFRKFTAEKGRFELVAEGIDTAAEIFINGKPALVTDNMFMTHRTDASELLCDGENEIVVHIKPSVIYARKYPKYDKMFALKYNYDALQFRKAPSMYGWDIAPRFVSGGIWRDIYLSPINGLAIGDVYLSTSSIDLEKKTANIDVRAEVSSAAVGGTLRINGKCAASSFTAEKKLENTSERFSFSADNCLFWEPINYGKPYLYDVTAELIISGKTVSEKTFRFGIRTVKLDRAELDGGRFDFIVNGHKVFIMGTNWVPVDAFHCRHRERIGNILPMLRELNCNMVRCWGGNVYECDEFFDYCDENGIMIWQDFGMACGIYPNDDGFLRRFGVEAAQIIKKYRNRASLAIWAGDNECDIACKWHGNFDPNENKITRELLPKLISELDPTRDFIPSSPYVDEVSVKVGRQYAEDHLWGPRDYYKGNYYKTAPAKFASETGYHGCPSVHSLEKFLTPKAVECWHKGDEKTIDEEWLVHAASPVTDQDAPYTYRIGLMASQVKTLLGYIPKDIESFSLASQISQGEAFKFFIERFRLNKATHGGIIWWNLIDCWPQISDAIVDYYYDKKLAYHYIKNVQKPISVIFSEPDESGSIKVVADSELTEDVTVDYKIYDMTEEKEIANGTANIAPHSSVTAELLSGISKNILIAEWSYIKDGVTVSGKNHFVSDARGISLEKLTDMVKRADIIKEQTV